MSGVWKQGRRNLLEALHVRAVLLRITFAPPTAAGFISWEEIDQQVRVAKKCRNHPGLVQRAATTSTAPTGGQVARKPFTSAETKPDTVRVIFGLTFVCNLHWWLKLTSLPAAPPAGAGKPACWNHRSGAHNIYTSYCRKPSGHTLAGVSAHAHHHTPPARASKTMRFTGAAIPYTAGFLRSSASSTSTTVAHNSPVETVR
jgi:hypothetical protein